MEAERGHRRAFALEKEYFHTPQGSLALARALSLSPFSFSFSLSVELPFLDTVKPPQRKAVVIQCSCKHDMQITNTKHYY